MSMIASDGALLKWQPGEVDLETLKPDGPISGVTERLVVPLRSQFAPELEKAVASTAGPVNGLLTENFAIRRVVLIPSRWLVPWRFREESKLRSRFRKPTVD